jgi:predicted RNA-binding Zn ribbon-like protein
LSVQADNHAPTTGQLELVQAFLNTRDLDSRRDELDTAEHVRRWLVRNRLLPPDAVVERADRQQLIDVRRAIHELVASYGRPTMDRRAVAVLNEAARRIRLGVRLHPDEGYRLMAEGVGIDRPIGDLLVQVMSAMADGTWSRLKVCANEACGRAFHDGSRNRSGRWCSMAACGNRMKGRAYRRRRASAAGGANAMKPLAVAAAAAG